MLRSLTCTGNETKRQFNRHSRNTEHICRNPHAENIFFAVQVDSYGDVDGLLHNLAFAPDMVVNGIQKYHRIDALQRPLLPFFYDGKDLICNPAYCCV